MEFQSRDNKLILPAIILGIAFIGAALIGSYSVVKLRAMNNTISVTGSAKTEVTSDQAKWNFDIRRDVSQSNLKDGYTLLTNDVVQVKKFLVEKNVSDTEYTISPVYTEQQYIPNQDRETPNKYTLRQTITVSSGDVDKITSLAEAANILVERGVFVSSSYLQYYYSKLPEVRVSLLANAIKDAKARAGEISSANGGEIGDLVSASSGVVQVMAPNSIDVSDYGTYDTSSKEKEITITVRAVFNIE